MAAIRRAGAQDTPALLRLLRGYCDEVGTPLSDDHLLSALEPLIADESLGDLFVAEQAGELIGYVLITWGWGIESGGREALVDEMYVDDPWRSQGIGTLLMTHAIARAKELDVKVVFLETELDNPESRALYERLGFENETSIWMSRAI